MYKVYAEAVFADNFAVNFLILLFACRLSAAKIRWGRCALAAAAGGVYAAVVYRRGRLYGIDLDEARGQPHHGARPRSLRGGSGIYGRA